MPTPDAIQDLITKHIDAWCAKSPEGVAASYSDDAVFSINRGDPMIGHADIGEMVKGFCDEFPDLVLRFDHSFIAGDHAVYVWTFTGTHAESGKKVAFQGWEEWDLDENLKVKSSLGWFDADYYERQLREDI
ncbi:nuclear transport factor 2 family protein [uncultured Roseovarius sp.]|uniref:nuclear transport factor 2 family protein n=1 Tax=uncultured Roseovarius sp. TaxID=293344 RepID=UPI00260D12FA|nr:nuclear transport factor 2 family protein [uncultured Roseovarius sp.]